MKITDDKKERAAGLRRQAEEIARAKAPRLSADPAPPSSEEMRQTLHNLQVHQIELELQNEELRRAQVELDAARARYFDLYDLAPVGYVTLSEQGLILEANLTAATLLGLSRGMLVKQPLSRFIFSEDQDLHYKHRRQLLETREPQSYELRLVQQSGTHLWVEMTATVMHGEDGAPVLRVVISEISKRMSAERALRESERNYRTLADSAPALIWAAGTDKLCNYFNQLWLQFSGRTLEQEQGNGWAEGVHADDLERCLAIYVDAFDRRAPFSMEYRLRRHDGEFRWMRDDGCPRYDPDGTFIGYLGFLMDITESKHSVMDLRKLSRAVEQSPTSIVITDCEGTIEYVNPRFEEVTGYSMAEALGQNPHILKSGKIPDYVYAQLWATISGGGEWRGELCNRRRNGELYWESVAISGVKGDSGAIEHYIAVKEDISERKRMEDVHLRAQKLESLGTLAGGIAHDFNNILAAIRGNADLAFEDVGPDHLAAESLQEIRKASDRASELVRRIKAFGRPKELRPDVVDLSAVVGEVLKLLRSTLPAGILLRREFAEDAPYVFADAGQIHEAIVNLTINAAYAIGPRAGSIVYRLESTLVDDQLARRIAGLKPGRYACLTVSDSGCGMDAATMERIFDAFYSTKPVGEGTGLGLAMVHGIMQGHNGAVTVESAPGKGSHFVLYFPAAASQAQVKKKSAPAQIIHCAGKRVLYIDDEEALVLLANRVLERLGHSVSGFTDPLQALKAFHAHPQDFDLVVTDLAMPRMSGFDLARQVLALRPDIPVLLTTGFMEDEDEQTAREAGIRKVLLKPVNIDVLGGILDEVFNTLPVQDAPDTRSNKDRLGRT